MHLELKRESVIANIYGRKRYNQFKNLFFFIKKKAISQPGAIMLNNYKYLKNVINTRIQIVKFVCTNNKQIFFFFVYNKMLLAWAIYTYGYIVYTDYLILAILI